jgi:manganese oxidase
MMHPRRLRSAMAFIVGLLATAALHGSARADDPAIPDLIPRYTRYALTQAYLHGGAAERDGLEAEFAPIPGADDTAVELGTDLDADGNPRQVHFRLEVDEIQEEVYPGKFLTFWVFAPLGQATASAARLPSPTLRVQEGELVKITLYNTHYLPHTIHLHGLNQSNAMDGDGMQHEVQPGENFTYEFVARNPGTYFYHCHVQEDVHVPMGLAGMLIVEPRRPHNHFARLIPGAGRIYSMGKATRESYGSEYSLVYMDVDERLNHIPATYRDPREIEWRMHRDYDTTRRVSDIFLLNGRSFPFTLRDTPILVRSGEVTRLRVLNIGPSTIYLHSHGHHPTQTDLDGIPLPEGLRLTRDTFDVGPAQRIDLALRAGSDGLYASGPGVWMMHDHSAVASTNAGIYPGGNQTEIVYDDAPDMMAGHAAHMKYFDPKYYQGKVPVFDPRLFATSPDRYPNSVAAPPPTAAYPARTMIREEPRLDRLDAERHRVVAQSCTEHPRSFQRIVIKAGRQFAREGEVFAFEPRQIRAERCQAVEIVLQNTDAIRHDPMISGLNPMFVLNVMGPGTASATFVTPDQDITLPFHCHVPAHDKAGMIGELIVGNGGPPPPIQVQNSDDGKLIDGVGVVIATLPRMGRLVVKHEEIKGFMAAMEMAYPVASPELLDGLTPGDKIEFKIDPGSSTIREIKTIGSAN